MSAYVIGNYNINDIETYMKYTKSVRDTLIKYEGKTLIADHEFIKKEGQPLQFIVAVELKSIEDAEKWYNSEDYRKIINSRKESTTGWV